MNNEIATEIWRDVPGYEGFYQASNFGNVRSVDRIVPNRRAGWSSGLRKGRVLRPKTDRYGYLAVALCKDAVLKHITVHRIIGLTFIDNPNNLLEINHKNTIRNDNRVDNLEWRSNQGNQFYKWETNSKGKSLERLNLPTFSYDKTKIRAKKLNIDKVREIRKMYSSGGFTNEDMGKLYNISGKTVNDIVNYKIWKEL